MGLLEKIFGPKMSKDEYDELFPQKNPFEDKGVVSLQPFIDKENEKTDQKKVSEVLNSFTRYYDGEMKILKNVKIDDYLIDAIIFTKKGVFVTNVIIEEGILGGEVWETHLRLYPGSAGSNINGLVYLNEKKQHPKKRILNPLGELVIWKQHIKENKKLKNINFFTISLYDTNLWVHKESLRLSPYMFDIQRLISFLATAKTIYSKKQIDDIYNRFMLLEE